HELLQLAYPGRLHGRDDEAEGGEDPANDRLPDRAAEPAEARLVREGLPDGSVGDVPDPVESAQQDVSVGGTGSRRTRTSMSIPRPASTAHLRLAVARKRANGNRVSFREAPFFSRAWGTSRFPTPLP